eukprot:SAG11_NODE_7182_length_1182_cov_1.222530_2_plen_105_part_00
MSRQCAEREAEAARAATVAAEARARLIASETKQRAVADAATCAQQARRRQRLRLPPRDDPKRLADATLAAPEGVADADPIPEVEEDGEQIELSVGPLRRRCAAS